MQRSKTEEVGAEARAAFVELLSLVPAVLAAHCRTKLPDQGRGGGGDFCLFVCFVGVLFSFDVSQEELYSPD